MLRLIFFLTLIFSSLIFLPTKNSNAETPVIVVNATLQMPESEEPIISTGNAILLLSACIAGGGLIFTGKTFRENARAKQLEVIKSIQDEITTLETSKERQSKSNYPVFAVQYLNTHNRLAFLVQKENLSKDVALFYTPNFKAALGILQLDDYKQYEPEMGYLTKWCSQNNITPGDHPQVGNED